MTRSMETDRKWIVVRVDGKLAGISQDYGRIAEISAYISQKYNEKAVLPYDEITAKAISFEEVLELRETARWEDLILFGTDFQKRVWKKLWNLTHNPDENESVLKIKAIKLLSYSDFAEMCQNRAGVRPVAHAIALNPLPIVIPCHLVVPKEAIDRIKEIQRKAESTIFKGEDLCHTSILNDNAIDFGEYALGKGLKRRLISMDMI